MLDEFFLWVSKFSHEWFLKSLYWSIQIINNWFWLGLFSACFVLVINSFFDVQRKSKSWIFWLIVGILTAPIPYLAYKAIPYLSTWAEFNYVPDTKYLKYWVYCFSCGIVFAFLWLRFGVHMAEWSKKKLTRSSSLERNKKTDVREIEKFLPASKKRFDPLKFINYKKGFFIGLSENGKPI